MKIRTAVALLLFVLPMLACGNTNDLRPGERGYKVNRQMFGEEWPFEKIEAGTVICESDASIFQASGTGIRYALNGIAQSRYGLQFPYQAGIVREVQNNGSNNSLVAFANTDVLRRLCDQ